MLDDVRFLKDLHGIKKTELKSDQLLLVNRYIEYLEKKARNL